MLYTVLAVVLPSFQNCLSIRTGLKAMASAHKGKPQLTKVIDFAIEDNPLTTVFIGHRLSTARNVDDAQSIGREANIAVAIKTVVIRPAMRRHFLHFCQNRFFDGTV